ncbi:MAG: hypothetical protein ACPG5B_09980 [Chitinophagales bacterium]
MKNILFSLFFCSSLLWISCNTTEKEENKTKQSQQTTTTSASYTSPLPKVVEILQNCEKVEYVLYNFGVTFESPGKGEVARFFSYIMDEPATQAACKNNKHDGSVVFKDAEGDIKMGMEFSFINGCERVYFEIEGQKYGQKMSEAGVGFFKQIISMQQQKQQEIQNN